MLKILENPKQFLSWLNLRDKVFCVYSCKKFLGGVNKLIFLYKFNLFFGPMWIPRKVKFILHLIVVFCYRISCYYYYFFILVIVLKIK